MILIRRYFYFVSQLENLQKYCYYCCCCSRSSPWGLQQYYSTASYLYIYTLILYILFIFMANKKLAVGITVDPSTNERTQSFFNSLICTTFYNIILIYIQIRVQPLIDQWISSPKFFKGTWIQDVIHIFLVLKKNIKVEDDVP